MDLQQEQAPPHERPFKDYFSPLANLSKSCIRYLNVAAMSFKLKPSVLNCLPTFYDLENEDPYNHLNDFYDVCQTFKYENFSDVDVKLRLFSFSFNDRARSWLNTLPANSITSWEQMVTKFLNKYFLVHNFLIKPMLFAGKSQSLPIEKTNTFSKHWSNSMGYF